MKVKFRVKWLVVVLIFALIIISYKLWLPLPGTFLLVKDNIHKADCIVPLAGDPYFRYKKAVELYNQGYSKKIVVSVVPERKQGWREYYNFRDRVLGLKEITPKEFVLEAFRYFGKGSQGIYFTDDKVTSTYDEAMATKGFMLKKEFKSLILVTSTYHMRRALMTFRLVFRGSGIKIYLCTAKNKLYNPHRWWRRESDVKTISLEYLSIAYNLFYHFILRKGRTSFDTY